MREMDDIQPAYAVGDRVIIANPIDFSDIDDTTVYEVTHVKFVPKYQTHAYRLNNGIKWVNESWLQPDIFGPQFLDEEVYGLKSKKQPDARKLLKLEEDYELASLHDAMLTQNSTEIQRSKARLHEIQNELEALK